MATERVADMTLEELTELIDERIKRLVASRNVDTRTMAEVNASIRRNRIVPPHGAKSAFAWRDVTHENASYRINTPPPTHLYADHCRRTTHPYKDRAG